jgi:hypothetical protein
MMDMIQEVPVKLNPGLPWKRRTQQEEDPFCQQTGLKFKKKN